LTEYSYGEKQGTLAHGKENKGDGKVNFAADVLLRLVTQLLTSGRGLVYLPVIAKTLGAADYGVWAQISITLTLLAPCLGLRLEMACVRYLSSKKGRKVARDFFGMLALIASTVLVAGIFLFLLKKPFASLLFDDPSLSNLIAPLLLLIGVRVLFQFLHGYYRAFRHIVAYSLIQLVQVALELGLLFTFVVALKWAIPGVVLSIVLAESILILGILTDILRREGFPTCLSWRNLWPYLKYSLPLIPNAALYWVINSSDRYVIVHFLNLEQVAIYSATYRLAQLGAFFLSPIAFVLFPTISKQWEEGKKDLTKRYVRGASRYYIMLALPAMVGIYWLGPSLLRMLTTSEFVIDRLLLLYIALGVCFIGLYQLYVYTIHLKEQTRFLPFVFLGVAGLNLGLNFIMVPRIGITGAAIATVISYFIQFCIIYGYSHRFYGVSIDLISLARVVAASASMFALIRLLPPRGWAQILGIVALGAVAYGLVMVLIGGVKREDWLLIRSVFTLPRREK
jgi:O-antigen/teichoic acid export membrane protein